MSSRRRARSYAVQALYQSDLGGTSARRALEDLWSALMDGDQSLGPRRPESAEIEFSTELATGAEAHREQIDAMIEQCSTNWRLSRMAAVDRNILRIGVFELLHRHEIPASVALNEAVELAKRFGSRDSRAFVNGILDRVARELGRV